jgi:hypothetical protein
MQLAIEIITKDIVFTFQYAVQRTGASFFVFAHGSDALHDDDRRLITLATMFLPKDR